MTPSALALRLGGQDHALEPGRHYRLGTAPDCDLRLPDGAAAHHARLRVDATGVEVEALDGPVQVDGAPVQHARLDVGASLALGPATATVVADTGAALLVPVPALRAAAQARRTAAVRDAAQALRHREAETFEALLAAELQRAPWLGASLALHLAVLLLLWLLLPVDEPPNGRDVTVLIDVRDARPPGQAPVTVPAVEVEAAPPVDVEALAEPPVEPDAQAAPVVLPPLPAHGVMPRPDARVAPRRKAAPSNGDRGFAAEVATLGSPEFRKTLAELQSGLEIVFVFDSTGSMSRTIEDTKRTIAQMLTVLRALVPDARFGIVTFRDHHASESYRVRELPLGTDFWRADNFVQGVAAAGGGDEPEDVRAGLRAAFEQRWRPKARRVVVLAGDAPPHERDQSRLLGEVRSFVRDGRSFVHALITSPERAGEATRRTFRAIAEAGGGECLDLAAHDRVLQQVLALAFGRRHDGDVATAIAAVTTAAERTDVAALDLAHRGGRDLAAALRAEPVPATLLHALVRRPRRHTMLELVAQLADRDTPEPTRHAIAWVLQRVLETSAPPVDPESGEPPSDRQIDRLREVCRTLAE